MPVRSSRTAPTDRGIFDLLDDLRCFDAMEGPAPGLGPVLSDFGCELDYHLPHPFDRLLISGAASKTDKAPDLVHPRNPAVLDAASPQHDQPFSQEP